MSDKTRWIWQFWTPWRKPWPLSAGLKFEFLSVGYFRYAGGGTGASIAVLGFEAQVQWWPMSVNLNEPITQQMGSQV
jgi:hypothetical protein